ncbi:hypothetical protein GCM10009555_097120 [Acrocarpospora macrocephala]|uniref:Uncharacterized protein n=1 Tax=Acrocarpospora macrocephala TaxID=150177 RepID=A0A5M3WRH1_9ACTN|nr:hypothetical protein Amac_029390 [Acrocarpospora macrocephala]
MTKDHVPPDLSLRTHQHLTACRITAAGFRGGLSVDTGDRSSSGQAPAPGREDWVGAFAPLGGQDVAVAGIGVAPAQVGVRGPGPGSGTEYTAERLLACA